MEILITHIWRSAGERIDVAGLTEDGAHVRPSPRVGTLTRADALGDFALGNVVHLADPLPAPTEDCPEEWRVDLGACLAVRTATDGEIHERLTAVVHESLADAFPGVQAGPDSRWVVPSAVPRSLAVVRARAWRLLPRFAGARSGGATRQSVSLGYHDVGLPAVRMPLTDLRLFPAADAGADFGVLQDLSAFLDPHQRVLACVGLSPPHAPDVGDPVRWTQAHTLWPDRSDRVLFA